VDIGLASPAVVYVPSSLSPTMRCRINRSTPPDRAPEGLVICTTPPTPHGLDLGQGREHDDVAGGDVRFHGPGLDDGGVPAEQDRK
jgi:hypothetical protein